MVSRTREMTVRHGKPGSDSASKIRAEMWTSNSLQVTFRLLRVLTTTVTGLLVVVSVLMGPISFIFSGAIDTRFAAADSTVTNLEAMLLSIFGVLLVFAWIKSAVRGFGCPVPYLPVTGWVLMGVYFCVALVFTHTT